MKRNAQMFAKMKNILYLCSINKTRCVNVIKIMIKDEEIKALGEMEVHDRDDTGKFYKKTIKFLSNSVRITFETALELGTCSKSSYFVYYAMLGKLGKYDYEVKASRADIKHMTSLSDASVSRSIEELKSKGLIEIVDKDTYHFPINKSVRGNVNKIIEREQQKQEELAVMEKERTEQEKIMEFTIKLRKKK